MLGLDKHVFYHEPKTSESLRPAPTHPMLFTPINLVCSFQNHGRVCDVNVWVEVEPGNLWFGGFQGNKVILKSTLVRFLSRPLVCNRVSSGRDPAAIQINIMEVLRPTFGCPACRSCDAMPRRSCMSSLQPVRPPM